MMGEILMTMRVMSLTEFPQRIKILLHFKNKKKTKTLLKLFDGSQCGNSQEVERLGAVCCAVDVVGYL